MFELHDIIAGYGSMAVLRGVSLCVPTGSVAALLGPNGAGKTTLLRTASGLVEPRSGDIRLDNESLVGLPPHRFSTRGVCHVGEGRSIFRGLTVRENLAMFAEPGREGAMIERAVESFPILGRRLSQIAGTLSGGEQQMLALSRTHASEHKVILLDEVSMGLAPKILDEIFAFLRGLAQSGASLLIVEQYAARALELAEYVFLLSRGQLVFVGEPGEVSGTDLMERYLAAGV